MADEKTGADEARNHTGDASPRANGATDRRWSDALLHRWPTALGVAVAALAAFDMADGVEFAALTMLMPLAYLGAAALDRRRFAWAVILAGVVVLTVLPSNSEVVPSAIFLAAALVFLVVGVARGRSRPPGGLPLQSVGMLAFGSTALAALYVEPDLGSYLVAFALLGHAAWDVYHLLENRVVTRSYAEWCAVVDFLLGAAILIMT